VIGNGDLRDDSSIVFYGKRRNNRSEKYYAATPVVMFSLVWQGIEERKEKEFNEWLNQQMAVNGVSWLFLLC